MVKTIRPLLLGVVIIAWVLCLRGVSCSQSPDDAAISSPEELQKKILEDKTLLQEEMKKVEELLAGAAGDEERRLYTELIDRLQKLDIVYEQQLVQARRSVDLSRDIEQVRKETAGGTLGAGAEDGVYPFSQFNELGDRLFLLEEQTGAFEEALQSADESYRAAREKLEGKEQEFRRVREAYGEADEDAARPPVVMVAQWTRRLAEEELALRRAFMENEKLRNSIHRLKRTHLQRRIDSIRGLVRFTREELDAQLADIEDDSAGLKSRLEQAKEKQQRAELRWRKDVTKSASEDEPPEAAQEREEELESLKLWYEAGNARVMLVSQLLTFQNDLKKLRQYRYELFHGTPLVDIPGWKKEISQGLKRLDQIRQKVIQIQTERLNEIIVRNEALASADRGSKISRFLDEQIRALKEREGLCRESLEALQKMDWEHKRLLADIQARESRRTVGESIHSSWVLLQYFWQYELTSVDDHPITVGKIITALLLLLFGYFISKRLTLQMGTQLRQRFAVDEAVAFAFQQIVHYLLLVLLLLFVLNLVRIPLTFFTVLGGALAIGVGFGSQTIVNNFLSGLILMLERPVKIGDIVEVEQVSGTVEWVGARSTIIKTFDNLRLVVPNSTMLQNKIINWSLTDDILRRTITVGVMYGSPVRMVEQLLLKAAGEHALVERYPAPQVFFEDFGDNALIFVLLVWVSMVRTGKEQSNIRRVESDIRFRIDELFRQEGIVIAFPQRDLHVDSLKPIEVRLKQE